MGINAGSIISQTFVPLFAIWFGYTWGFVLAGIGMCFAWARFQFAGPQLEPYGNPPANAKNIEFPFYVGTLCAIPVVWFLLNNTMTTASIAHKVAAVGVFGFVASLPFSAKCCSSLSSPPLLACRFGRCSRSRARSATA